MEPVEVVVAHDESVTLRVGDVFLKVDGDQARSDREVEAMRLAPVPTPEVRWRQPPVLALGALPGTPIARLGHPSTASAESWRAAGAALRRLHDAPVPSWAGRTPDAAATALEEECAWLLANQVLPASLVTANRRIAEAVLEPWTPVFAHNDLQVAHVFVADEAVTGVIDWTEAGPGDPRYDLATLTLGHRDHLADVLDGYGRDVAIDLEVISGWWSWRSLTAIRWLAGHGFDPEQPGCEVDVLRAQRDGVDAGKPLPR